MTRPFFTKDRISHFENFDRHADEAIYQLKTRLNEGYAVDIQVRSPSQIFFPPPSISFPFLFYSQKDIATRFTLDSATEFLFGMDLHSLSTPMPYPYNSPQAQETAKSSSHLDSAARFAKAFSEAQSISLSRLRFGLLWPLIEFWHDRIEEPMKIVHELIDPIVVDAIAKKKILYSSQEKSPTDRAKTLLEDLASSTDGK
jgi:hypothetical protein